MQEVSDLVAQHAGSIMSTSTATPNPSIERTSSGRLRLPTAAASAHENVLKPGAEVPSHQHGVEEVIVCLEGVGECSFANQPPARYYAGSVVIIPPETPHVLRNAGDSILRQICFFAGNPTNTKWVALEGSVADLGGNGGS